MTRGAVLIGLVAAAIGAQPAAAASTPVTAIHVRAHFTSTGPL